MKSLIIGGAGFVGPYLARYLKDARGHEVCVTKLPHEKTDIDDAVILDMDLLSPGDPERVLSEVRPDWIFHLAAQSNVGVSWKKPGLTLTVNDMGALNLLEAVKKLDYKPRLLMVGSGEEYGYIREEDVPVDEDTVLRPGNIYAATKAFQNMLSSIYARAYGMDVIMTRAFNHIGKSQMPGFVIPDFCKQVAEIEIKGLDPVIKVGNLSSMRDFTDVRDVVRAYALLMEHGKSGETYNIGSGRSVKIQWILDTILSFSDTEIRVEQDPARMRPSDVPVIEADISKLKAATGWEPEYRIEDTIREALDHWREKVKEETGNETS